MRLRGFRGLGFQERDRGLGFRVYCLGFVGVLEVWGLFRFRVQGFGGFRDLALSISGLGSFGVRGLHSRAKLSRYVVCRPSN